MLRRLRARRPSHPTVVAYLALFVALGGTGAYAANTISSADIIDNEVRSADVRDDTLSGGGLSGGDIANGAMTTLEIRDDNQPFGGLFSQDLAAGSVRSSEVLDNSLGNGDFLTGSVDGRVATDNSLTGADIQNLSLTTSDVAAETFTGADIANGSLTGADIASDSLTGTDINESTLQGGKDGDSCGSSGATFFSNARLCAGSDGVNRSVDEAHAFCTSINLRLPTWGEAVLLARGDVPGVTPPDFFWTDEIAGYDDRVNEYFVLAVNEDGVDLAFSPPQNSRRTVCVTTPD